MIQSILKITSSKESIKTYQYFLVAIFKYSFCQVGEYICVYKCFSFGNRIPPFSSNINKSPPTPETSYFQRRIRRGQQNMKQQELFWQNIVISYNNEFYWTQHTLKREVCCTNIQYVPTGHLFNTSVPIKWTRPRPGTINIQRHINRLVCKV